MKRSYLVLFRLFLVAVGAMAFWRLSMIARGAAGLGFALFAYSSSRS